MCEIKRNELETRRERRGVGLFRGLCFSFFFVLLINSNRMSDCPSLLFVQFWLWSLDFQAHFCLHNSFDSRFLHFCPEILLFSLQLNSWLDSSRSFFFPLCFLMIPSLEMNQGWLTKAILLSCFSCYTRCEWCIWDHEEGDERCWGKRMERPRNRKYHYKWQSLFW